MKNLLLTATRHNEGKTVLALGLVRALVARGKKVAYFKPIGQAGQDASSEGRDPDAVLMKAAAEVPGEPNEISPVLLQGFPSDWATREGHDAVLGRIKRAFAKVTRGCDFAIIEAMGNAAAGAGFGLSNAYLARILDARVVLTASGGVGQPTDEIILNKSYFERTGIEVVGVIVNKAYPHETERLNTFMKRVLETINIKLIGTVPYDPDLSRPALQNLADEFRATLVTPKASLGATVGRFVFGAMGSAKAAEQFKGNITLICPVDRDDLLTAALNAVKLRARSFKLAGVIFAGLGELPEAMVKAVTKAEVPAIQIEIDAYSLAYLIHSTRYKVSPSETDRIDRAAKLIAKHVDVDTILEKLK